MGTNGNGQGLVTDSPRLASLRAKLSAEKAAVEAVRSAVSAEDRAELELRAELRAAEEERRAEELSQRQLDLDRREEAAREAHQNAKIAQLAIQDHDDTFVIMGNQLAHSRWEKGIRAAATNKKLSEDDFYLSYAVDAVIDWNGIVDFDHGLVGEEPAGRALKAYLKTHPAMVTLIVNEAIRLAGYVKEAHKS